MAEQALIEKNKGDEAYKRKDFASALNFYDKAIELDPTNIKFYSNKGACFFEEGKFEECIEVCKKAVEIGRENKADFSLVAKAYSRIGNAYLKTGDKKNALVFFEKSLSEHRDPQLVNKKVKLEKEIKEEERLAYLNPELAEEERLKGNDAFKKGDYPTAIKDYSEAIKRNPESAVLFSNRATAYAKLMEFQRSIDDCDACLRLDSTFLKAYLRKGTNLVAIHEYIRAQKCFEEALMIDQTNKEALEGLMACNRATGGQQSAEKRREEALQDPDVQAILADPSMRLILEQMSQDPKAAQEHLKNPDIFRKIMKLKEAGIVGLR